MKKSNKKGFTIVELVIVIAVIAILAAVLIPTFSSVVTNAKKSAAMQEARNAYEEYLAENAATLDLAGTNICITVDGYHFHVVKGQFEAEADKNHAADESFDTAVITDNKLVVTPHAGA